MTPQITPRQRTCSTHILPHVASSTENRPAAREHQGERGCRGDGRLSGERSIGVHLQTPMVRLRNDPTGSLGSSITKAPRHSYSRALYWYRRRRRGPKANLRLQAERARAASCGGRRQHLAHIRGCKGVYAMRKKKAAKITSNTRPIFYAKALEEKLLFIYFAACV